MITHHAYHEPPTHPLFNTPILNPAQIHPMIIRVRDDADRRYSDDARFAEVTDDEKVFTIRILSKLIGEEYAVMKMEVYNQHPFYNIRVLPAFNAHDIWGISMRVSAAIIPADYTELVRASGCPEAR